MTSVDVVIVTRNTRDLTVRCVGSVLDAVGKDLEISCRVVDNASSDCTAEALADAYPQANVIRNSENRGYGEACNQGLASGTSEYVLILNSDVWARPGAIARLIAYLESRRTHVAAGGRLVDPGTEDVQLGHNVRAFPRLLSQSAQAVGLERTWPRNPISRRQMCLDLDYSRTQDVEQPAGACLAVRREAFDAIGGFDEAFYYWFEDVDLARRLRDLGRIAYVHDATFEHVKSATFQSWQRPSALESWYSGMIRYFAKHRPRREQVGIRALIALIASVRLVALRRREPGAAAACRSILRSAMRGA